MADGDSGVGSVSVVSTDAAALISNGTNGTAFDAHMKLETRSSQVSSLRVNARVAARQIVRQPHVLRRRRGCAAEP